MMRTTQRQPWFQNVLKAHQAGDMTEYIRLMDEGSRAVTVAPAQWLAVQARLGLLALPQRKTWRLKRRAVRSLPRPTANSEAE
jgi:hypothetical protein